MTSDPIFKSFFINECEELSAMVELNPGFLRVTAVPPNAFLVQFICKGLLREPGGEIEEAPAFVVGIRLPANYCREAPDPTAIAHVIAPHHPWHPNVHGPSGRICVGHIGPSTSVADLIMQIYTILIYRNYATHDGLSPEAAQWARHHQDRFPLEQPRPIHLPPNLITS